MSKVQKLVIIVSLISLFVNVFFLIFASIARAFSLGHFEEVLGFALGWATLFLAPIALISSPYVLYIFIKAMVNGEEHWKIKGLALLSTPSFLLILFEFIRTFEWH